MLEIFHMSLARHIQSIQIVFLFVFIRNACAYEKHCSPCYPWHFFAILYWNANKLWDLVQISLILIVFDVDRSNVLTFGNLFAIQLFKRKTKEKNHYR